MDYIGTFFFQLWCEACSFSKICFHENTTCLCCFGPYYHFSCIFRIKKDAQGNFAINGPYESPWIPTFDDLVQFQIMSVQNNPHVDLLYKLVGKAELLKSVDGLRSWSAFTGMRKSWGTLVGKQLATSVNEIGWQSST